MTVPMVKLKNYKLRSSGNSKGQLIQIPIAVIREWGLQEGDEVEMHKTIDGDLVIRPRRDSVPSQ